MNLDRLEVECDQRPGEPLVVAPDEHGLIRCVCGTVLALEPEPVGETLRRMREAWAEQESPRA